MSVSFFLRNYINTVHFQCMHCTIWPTVDVLPVHPGIGIYVLLPHLCVPLIGRIMCDYVKVALWNGWHFRGMIKRVMDFTVNSYPSCSYSLVTALASLHVQWCVYNFHYIILYQQFCSSFVWLLLFVFSFNHVMFRYNLLFFVSGGGKFNYQGTKRWLEDNLDHTGTVHWCNNDNRRK